VYTGPGGYGGKQNPGSNIVSTGNIIVPVRKENILSIKNDESSTPTHPETRKG